MKSLALTLVLVLCAHLAAASSYHAHDDGEGWRPLDLVPTSTELSLSAADETTSGAASATPTRRPRCKFTIDGSEYDLCPLLTTSSGETRRRPRVIEWEMDTFPTLTKTTYRLGLTAPLKVDGTLPEHERCPEGTFICMTVSNTRPDHKSEPPRILQVVPVAGTLPLHPDHNHTRQDKPDRFTKLNITARIAPVKDEYHGALQLRMHGGIYTAAKKPQAATLSFFCAHDVDEPTEPAYRWTWNGTHSFTWRTKHACPLNHAKDPQQPDPPASDQPPREDGGDTPKEEPIFDPPPEDALLHPRRQWKHTLGAVLGTLLGLCALALLLFHPRAQPVRAFVLSRAPVLAALLARVPSLAAKVPLPWRHRRRSSAGWSDEDTQAFLSFEAGADEDEDEMVNGGGEAPIRARAWNAEEIPLTPSPRRATFGPVGYGSTG